MDDMAQPHDFRPQAGAGEGQTGLTISEAAARSGVAEKTVRRMIKAGSLPHSKQPIPGGFRYLVPLEAVAQIAHEVGDRVLPHGIPSTPPSGGGGQDTQHLQAQDTYPGGSASDKAVDEPNRERDALHERLEDLARERDEWKVLAQSAQGTIQVLSETIQRLNETNRQLALPEHRQDEEEEKRATAHRWRFWEWFLGR